LVDSFTDESIVELWGGVALVFFRVAALVFVFALEKKTFFPFSLSSSPQRQAFFFFSRLACDVSPGVVRRQLSLRALSAPRESARSSSIHRIEIEARCGLGAAMEQPKGDGDCCFGVVERR